MREMKDSGVEWIGEIPKNWKICRLKDYAHICNGRDYSEVLDENGDYPVIGSGGQFAKACEPLYQKESVLLGRKGTIDKPLFVDYPFWTVDTMYYTEIKENVSAKYFYYLCTQIEFDFYQYGSAVPSMTQRDLYNVNFPYPTLDEQRRIANYLDRKCSQIDTIIAQQQEVIEKLKAYKLSVITEAVTKGLNPDVPMKDSGVEWIGEIPEHWDFRRIKNCCLIVDCKNRTPDPDPDGEYIVVRTTCIRDGSFSYEGSYHTNAENFKEWTAKGQPQHGDIFFTREAPMGEACLVPDTDNLCMGQRVMFFRPLDGSDPRYILYSIYGPLAREYIDSKNKGSTVGHLKLGQVASLPLFYCPPREQSEIANYLDKRCGAIDKVVEKKAEIISRITDYKKSLIYEVVTGKRYIR